MLIPSVPDPVSFFKKKNNKIISEIYPGLETRVTGSEISERMTAGNWSYLTISFDPLVTIQKPSPWNWYTYLAVLGGTMGLWLGLGMLQLIEILAQKVAAAQTD